MKVASLVALALALASAGAVAAWGWQRAAGESAEFPVLVIGPDGPFLDERVHVEEATVLRALQAAADARGVTLSLVEYPGLGTYVRAIGPYEASGVDGWIYEVERDGAWRNGDRTSAEYPLQKGDAVRWTWTGR